LALAPRYVTVSFEPDATWENDEALIVEIAGEDREYVTVFQRRLGVLDLEFWCEDEADAKELFWKLRDALPKRFNVKTPTSASTRDLSSGNGSPAGT
jgi:hypothetical protein